MKLSLRKRQIIRGHARFQEMIRGGQKAVGNYVIAFALPSSEAMVGVSVGRRICNAVRRNRQKRRLREIFRTNKIIFEGLNVLLIARQNILRSQYIDLQSDVVRTVSRVREKMKDDSFEQTLG